MSSEPPLARSVPGSAPGRVQIVFESDPFSVREGLRRLFDMAPLCMLSADARGTAEIVLAEALNNIVEHAYAKYTGAIHVTLDHDHPNLYFELVDYGLPMPDSRLPSGDLVPFAAVEDLPEGGFGWFLIRSLTRGLVYQHRSGANRLMFCIETE